MKTTVIRGAFVVNEGLTKKMDVAIRDGRIVKIDESINFEFPTNDIDAEGLYLMPGIIDDQVHFREPGLTHKGDIWSESRAAAAGGVTSFIEQPNTNPATTTIPLFLEKLATAKTNSFVNFGFNFGATNSNADEIARAIDKHGNRIPGIKIFMGSSTGDMLVDSTIALEKIFQLNKLKIVHCESERIIREKTAEFIAKYGDNIPYEMHCIIRNEECCLESSTLAVALAKQFNTRLHIYHVTTAQELVHFRNDIPLEKKLITGEGCLVHLYFSSSDYQRLGSKIKQNPAVKHSQHRTELIKALIDGRLDILATDHAPHTLEEKMKPYTSCPSGAPWVQHLLAGIMDLMGRYIDGESSLQLVVEKACHNPAILFGIKERGYIREGYYADLALVNLKTPWTVSKENILYKCGWSAFEGNTFNTQVCATFVNGILVYDNMQPNPSGLGTFTIDPHTSENPAKELYFNR